MPRSRSLPRRRPGPARGGRSAFGRGSLAVRAGHAHRGLRAGARPRPPDRIEIPPLEGFAVEAAADDVEIRLSVNDNQSFVGLVPVAVQLLSAGEELRRGVVTVRVEVSERVPVAARPLRSGHVIGPDDVLLEPRELGSLPSGAVTDPAELVGQRVTRYVDAGRPLLREGIERAPGSSAVSR